MGDRIEREPLRPFANGTEAEWWFEHNCYRCGKWSAPDAPPTCEIDKALFEAFSNGGIISPSIGERMGYPKLAYNKKGERYTWWPCPEHEAEG